MNQEENLENHRPDMETSVCRLATKKQSLDDMYSVPANFLEIDVINPSTTIIAGKKKFTDYEIRMRVSEMNPRKERGEKKSVSMFLFRTSLSASHSLSGRSTGRAVSFIK